MESAKKQSDYQASIRMMTHGGPLSLFDRFTQVGFEAQAVAENVAWTSGSSIDRVVKLWINSPGNFITQQYINRIVGHYANMIGNYTHFGSYVSIGADGKYYWTQHFAKPWAGVKEPCMSILGWGTTVNPASTTVTSTPHTHHSHSTSMTITTASLSSSLVRPHTTGPAASPTSFTLIPTPTRAPTPTVMTTLITTVITVIFTVYR